MIAGDQAARFRQYAPAYETLTRIIEAAEARGARADRNNLIAWYEKRADVSLFWGLQLQSRNPTFLERRRP